MDSRVSRLFRFGRKGDQHVHVAIWTEVGMQSRAENGKLRNIPTPAKLGDLGFLDFDYGEFLATMYRKDSGPFAFQFLGNGCNIYTLQNLPEHTALDMVKRYLAISQVDLDRDHEKASPVKGWNL